MPLTAGCSGCEGRDRSGAQPAGRQPVKLGCSLILWTDHVTEGILPVLKTLKETGYAGVEVPLSDTDAARYAALGQMIAAEGLAVTTLGFVPGTTHDPTSDDPGIRQAAADHLKRLVDCARAIGSEVLGGPYYQTLNQFSGGPLSAAEHDRIVMAHQAMADHAGPGLTLAVEAVNRFEGYAVNTSDQAAALVADVGRANYGWLLDTFHANIEDRDPLAAIRAHGRTLRHLHLSETDRGTVGGGHLDIPGHIAALKAAGYDGWLMVESLGHSTPSLATMTKVWRPLMTDETEAAATAFAVLRNALSA